MRQSLLPVLLALLFVTGCSKKDPAPQEAPAPNTAAAKETPAPQPAPAPAPDAVAVAEEPAPDNPAKTTAQPADKPAPAPEKPALLNSESGLSDSQCKVKVQEHDRRIREEILPHLKAETKAATEIQRWSNRAFELLAKERTENDKERLAAFWAEYEKCVAKLAGDENERDKDPYAAAYGAVDQKGCEYLEEPAARAECMRVVLARERHAYLKNWKQSDFGAEFCRKIPRNTQAADPAGIWEETALELARCEAVARNPECGESLFQALREQLEAETRLCEAARHGLSGGACAGRFDAASRECQVVNIARADDREALCTQLEETGRIPVHPALCRNLEMFQQAPCDNLVKLADDAKRREATTSFCKMVLASREGRKSCEGLFEAGSPECRFLNAHLQTRDEDKGPQGHRASPLRKAAVEGPKGRIEAPPEPGKEEETVDNFLSLFIEDEQERKWGTNSTDDTECRHLILDRKVLPAPQNRTELRLSLNNPFIEKATCELAIEVQSPTSSSRKKVTVILGGSQVKTHSEYFVAEPDSEYTVRPKCTWTLELPAEKASE